MKKVIAFIVSASMLLCGTAFAEDSNKQTNTYYNEAARVIEALEIADGTDSGNESVTRLEVLKSVVNVLTRNADYNVSGANMPFVDVPSAENRSVSYAFETGLITADSVYFRPSDIADYSFAESLMFKAMRLYNYPYKVSSQRTALIKKLHLSGGSFTKGDLYVMLYNMLCANDNKMLYDIFNIETAKAFVIANDLEAYDGKVCRKGYVRLEVNKTGAELNLKYEQDSSELLGRMVKVFYDTDDCAVLMIEQNDIVAEIVNADFQEYDASTRELRWTNGTYGSLWNEKISKGKLVLSKDMDIVFNERFTTQHSKVYDILENGGGYDIDKITLFDRDNDGDADLMKISAYQTVLVGAVDSAKMIVKVQNADNIIDFKNEEPEPELKISDKNGNTVNFSDIKKNSVLSVFYKLDSAKGESETLKIIVSTDTVSGKVSSKSEENSRYKAAVSGTDYILSNGAQELASELKVGKSYKAYLDHNGEIAWAEMLAESGTDVGAVMNVATEGKLNPVLTVKIFSANGETLTLNAAKNFKIDDAKVTFQNGNIPVYTAADGTKAYVKDALYGCVVRYTINDNGELSSLDLPKMGAKDGEFGYTAGINDMKDIMTNSSRYKLIYKTSGRYFFPGWSTNKAINFVGIDSSTRILKIPSNEISENRDEYFQKGKLSEFSNDKTYAIIGFNANGGNKTVADVVAVVTDVSVDFTNAQYYVVKDVCFSLNNNDSYGYEFTLANKNGAESTITTADTVLPEFDSSSKQYTGNYVDIEKGDIIRYSLDAYGDANAFIVDYDCSAEIAKEEKADSFYDSSRLVFGSVYKANGSMFAYVPGKTISDDSEIWLGSSTKVVTVEVKRKNEVEVTIGTPDTMIGYTDDNARYSYIVYATKNGECNIAVEYRR